MNNDVCMCNQIFLNIANELDGFYKDAHNSAYSNNAQEFYASQYQLLISSYDRVGFDIKRDSNGNHVVSYRSQSLAEPTNHFGS